MVRRRLVNHQLVDTDIKAIKCPALGSGVKRVVGQYIMIMYVVVIVFIIIVVFIVVVSIVILPPPPPHHHQHI